MRKYNKQDYEQMKVFEPHFTRAIQSRFVTGIKSTELTPIQVLYRECLGRQANLSCPGCVLQMLTSIGRLHFKFKEQMETEIAQIEESVQPQPKKKGRPKKNNTTKTETDELL